MMRDQLRARLSRSQIDAAKRLVARGMASDLDRLARLFGTDKRAGQHGYTAHYAHHLRNQRRQVRSVLEIGVQDGASIQMWSYYFPHAHIFGIDLDVCAISHPRVTLFKGDQVDHDVLRAVAHVGAPFDLIIDDGSHYAGHAEASFRYLFQYLRKGGLYVIEDLETAYDDRFGGGPPGTPGTSVALVRNVLIDSAQGHGDLPISALHIYKELVLIEHD